MCTTSADNVVENRSGVDNGRGGTGGGADNDDAGDDGNSPTLLTPTSRAGVPPNRTFKCRLELRVLPWVMLLLMENGGQGFWCN